MLRLSLCQRGDALLEALVGIILLAIIGLGVTYALSRSVLVQRSTNAQGIVVNEIREHVKTVGVQKLCDKNNKAAKSVDLNGKKLELNIDESACRPATITVEAVKIEGDGNASISSTKLVTVDVPNRITSFSISTEGEVARGLLGDGDITVSHR